MIPVVSWVLLNRRCRYCKAIISWLYPFIELLTAISMSLLITHISPHFIPGYFFFFSALIVTIRTDIETMLISRFVSLFLVPFGILFSLLNLISLSPQNSILGAFIGYFIPWLLAYIFLLLTGKQGMGVGDFELLAFIGSFLGVCGCWMSLVLGSILGSLYALIQVIAGRAGRDTKVPFGPFLAFGALLFVLFKQTLLKILFI